MRRKVPHFKKFNLRQRHSHRFDNPYFSKNKKGVKFGPILKKTAIFALILAILYGINVLPLLQIREIRVEGTVEIPREQFLKHVDDYLNSKKFFILNRRNILFFDKTKLIETISDIYALDEILIGREGRSLSILIKEKVSGLIWYNGTDFHFVSRDGRVLRKLSRDEGEVIKKWIDQSYSDDEEPVRPYLPILYDEAEVKVRSNQQLLTSELTEDVIQIITTASEIAGINIHNASLREDNSWLVLNTIEGVDIYFDTKGEVASQINNLNTVVSQSIDEIEAVEYIDLRFGERVYFK